jgi:hypothetical protein
MRSIVYTGVFEVCTAVTVQCRLLGCGALWVLWEPTFRKDVFWIFFTNCYLYSSAKATRSPETLALTRPTRCHVSQDGILHRGKVCSLNVGGERFWKTQDLRMSPSSGTWSLLSRPLLLVSCSADFSPWKWRSYVPPKRRFTYGLRGTISQMMDTWTKHNLHQKLPRSAGYVTLP